MYERLDDVAKSKPMRKIGELSVSLEYVTSRLTVIESAPCRYLLTNTDSSDSSWWNASLLNYTKRNINSIRLLHA